MEMAAEQCEGASPTEPALKNGEDGEFNVTCIFHHFLKMLSVEYTVTEMWLWVATVTGTGEVAHLPEFPFTP